jgi:hypothetical protein
MTDKPVSPDSPANSVNGSANATAHGAVNGSVNGGFANGDVAGPALRALQAKVQRLVHDFAGGRINRTQFHEVYGHYHRQIARIMQLSGNDGDQTSLMQTDHEDTYLIKKRLTAKVIGVSVYDNSSSLPIETVGEFSLDPGLLVPMLSSYRAAAREIFKAGVRSTAMENNQWLCFVPGNFTTLLGLFSVEPASMQVANLEQMHRDFENANHAALEKGNVDPSALAFPFLTIVRGAYERQTGKHSTMKEPDEG